MTTFAICPKCGHNADDHAAPHGDNPFDADFDPCLIEGCDCLGPFHGGDQ